MIACAKVTVRVALTWERMVSAADEIFQLARKPALLIRSVWTSLSTAKPFINVYRPTAAFAATVLTTTGTDTALRVKTASLMASTATTKIPLRSEERRVGDA